MLEVRCSAVSLKVQCLINIGSDGPTTLRLQMTIQGQAKHRKLDTTPPSTQTLYQRCLPTVLVAIVATVVATVAIVSAATVDPIPTTDVV